MSKSTQSDIAAFRAEPPVIAALLAAILPGLYLLLTSSYDLIPGIWLYDAKRMLQFGLLFMLFLLPAFSTRIRTELCAITAAVPVWSRWALLAVFVWGSLSALVNARGPMHLANSMSEVVLLASLVLGILVIAACRRSGPLVFDRLAIGLLALTALVVGVQELIGAVAALSAGSIFSYSESFLHFAHPRFYNQFQSWAVPVVATLPLLFGRYPLARWMCLIVLGLHWYLLLMTAGRGSLVGLISAFIFVALAFPAIRNYLLKWQLAGFVLGAGLYLFILVSFEGGSPETTGSISTDQAQTTSAGSEQTRQEPTESSVKPSKFLSESLGRPMLHSSGRKSMWLFTLKESLDSPLIGIGPMNLACTSKLWVGHPHNFPLQIIVEWGIPIGVTVLLVGLIVLFRTSRIIRCGSCGSPEDVKIAGLLFTGVLAAVIHSCFSGIMVMPASQVTGMVICGMLFSYVAPAFERGNVISAKWIFIPGLVFAFSLALLGTKELHTMEDRAQLLPKRIMEPRMWQDSKVCTLHVSEKSGLR